MLVHLANTIIRSFGGEKLPSGKEKQVRARTAQYRRERRAGFANDEWAHSRHGFQQARGQVDAAYAVGTGFPKENVTAGVLGDCIDRKSTRLNSSHLVIS